jgi:hypothetical protein
LKLGKGPAEARRFADEAERLLFAAAPEFPRLLGIGLASAGLAAELGARLEPGTPYLLLSWAPGKSLDHVLSEGVLSQAEREALALSVARDIGAALAALHASGAAHGDVKPANIVIGAERARLVDFGLSGAAHQALPSGGTRRYLAPELFAGGESDARARDLWALGATLLDVLDPTARPEAAWVPSAELNDQVMGGLAPIIRALLSSAPGARASASWVSRRAQLLAPSADDAAVERRKAAVRRAYLRTRQAEIGQAARHKSVPVPLTGAARAWLEEACALAAGIARLRGAALAEDEAAPLRELSDSGRARFLVALVGPAAAAWPALRELDEASLLNRLLELAALRDPESFTLAAIERGKLPEHVAASATAVEVALALRAAYPDPLWLDVGETIVRREKGPLGLALALGRAFRLRGELGRALAFLSGFREVEARVASAELCRRA